jgi:hypothetical protein
MLPFKRSPLMRMSALPVSPQALQQANSATANTVVANLRGNTLLVCDVAFIDQMRSCGFFPARRSRKTQIVQSGSQFTHEVDSGIRLLG